MFCVLAEGVLCKVVLKDAQKTTSYFNFGLKGFRMTTVESAFRECYVGATSNQNIFIKAMDTGPRRRQIFF